MNIVATAPGKVILFGEHAVVYGRPAIAIPVTQVRATAVVTDNPNLGIRFIAPDLGTDLSLTDANTDDPVAAAIRQVQTALQIDKLPAMTVTVTSEIPIASGLGSGAAITAALIRAVAQYLGESYRLTSEWVSQLTYEVEKIHHGTPSGIDNTVVSYEQPVYFVRQSPRNRIETFHVAAPLHLLIADTGIRSATKDVVGDVRRQWQANMVQFEQMFDGCGRLALSAREAIEQGEVRRIGRLMNENHVLLQEMTVSSPALDSLVVAAQEAGALGAKLSGAGRGGNMIALVEEGGETVVYAALKEAGAKAILKTIIAQT